MAAYLLKKEVEKKSYLDSKSTLFEVINNFRLYDRVCIVSALRSITCHTSYAALSRKMGVLMPSITFCGKKHCIALHPIAIAMHCVNTNCTRSMHACILVLEVARKEQGRRRRTEVVSRRAVQAGGRLGATPCMATMSE